MSARRRLAILGLGLVGVRHLDAVASLPDVDVIGAVDPAEAGKIAACKRNIPWFETIEELFEGAEFDGLIIATPTLLHIEQALYAIKKGCPVLVEKPLSTHSSDAEELISAAALRGVPILVGHHRRHNPLVQAAKSALVEGRIGEVCAVHSTCWFYKPDAYFEAAPWRTKSGAGPVSVNLVHDVDLLRFFCGDVRRVVAQTAPSKRGFENEELAAAILTFESGAIGTLSVSDSAVSPWSWEFTSKEYPVYPVTGQSCYHIGGTRGALSIPDLKIWTHEQQPDWWRPIHAQTLPFCKSDPLVNQISHFVRVIDGQAEPLVSGVEGLKSLQVIEAIALSAEQGGFIDMNEAFPPPSVSQAAAA